MAKVKNGAGRRATAKPVPHPHALSGTNKTVRFLFRFLVDVALAGASFLILLLLDCLVGAGVHLIEHWFHEPAIEMVMNPVHMVVIGVDAILFLWFVVKSAVKAAKEIE